MFLMYIVNIHGYIFIPLKEKKGETITRALENVIKDFDPKQNKVRVGK